MKHIGNTNSSTVPIGLDELKREGRFKPGQKIMLAGYESGLSWSGVIIYA